MKGKNTMGQFYKRTLNRLPAWAGIICGESPTDDLIYTSAEFNVADTAGSLLKISDVWYSHLGETIVRK